ncbi:MAG: phosphate ABC transporter substrate-binding/OmpA family protein [Gemmatimonadaceae bacterium]|nr:phosphate ABC transporter substrate-binding/OmpA family protein [Gemmatimonadaceae bacterium]
MPTTGGGPKPAFYLVMFALVVAVIGYGVYRFKDRLPLGDVGSISVDDLKKALEAPDDASLTTFKEYDKLKYQEAGRMPEVKGVSNYAPLVDNTIVFALNVWAGWAPIILANNGFEPGKVWTAPNGRTFKVKLTLIDDPVSMRDAYAAGKVHIGWATVDMLPLFLEQLKRDSRTMPRVYQQIDYSFGGDGIVCRDAIKTVSDIKGKTIVLAQNSPSHYFALNAMISGGLQPADVEWKYTADAFQAAAAFNADKKIACAVSWSPDIYNLAKAAGNKMLVNTQTANKLIADTWFMRADVAKDHPYLAEGLMRGIFDAMEQLTTQAGKTAAAKLMATGYSLPEADALAMLGDAHNTNVVENREFFLNANNPANFQRTFETAYFLYRKVGALSGDAVAFDDIFDGGPLTKLAKDPKYANQKNEYQIQFVPTTALSVQAESSEILTKAVVIQFFPNSDSIFKMVTKSVNGKTVDEMYDPNVKNVVEEVGRLAGQYGAARIVIEGHTDASMRSSGMVTAADVQELSLRRANAVKEAIVRKFSSLNPNQFSTAGIGWDRPADASDANNNAKNRRVEIKVYPLEQK